MSASDYTITVGIECHVQLKTKTKLFAAVGNDARDADPNTLVSHICFGMPGALPVLNREAVRLAAKAAFALGTEPQRFSKFDRKHYFYPDLPKGYQISQFDQPIISGGFVDIEVDGAHKRIGITRAHMEEDAGKSTHPAGQNYSLLDLNRAGTPLLEIVSEPDIHTPAEAKAYARELYLLMKYADVSDADLYYGNMRFDVNVSVSKTDEWGTRTETKNINSFRAVEKVVEYEANRQIKLLESGEAIVQETRGWDEDKQVTVSQRTKEDAHDYRYFPDPDIPPIVLTDEYVAEIQESMPIMPGEYRRRWAELGLDESVVGLVLSYRPLAEMLDAVRKRSNPDVTKRIFNWFASVPAEELDIAAVESGLVGPSRLTELSEMVAANKLSSTGAKEVFLALFDPATKGKRPEEIAKERNLLQESDEGAIAAIVADVIASNPKAAEDVRSGEMKAIGFLTGQVMKASQGKANPALATQLIRKQLEV